MNNPEETGFSPDLREKCSSKSTQTALQASLQGNLPHQFLRNYAAANQTIGVDSPQNSIGWATRCPRLLPKGFGVKANSRLEYRWPFMRHPNVQRKIAQELCLA
jgi:hypothetical protein